MRNSLYAGGLRSNRWRRGAGTADAPSCAVSSDALRLHLLDTEAEKANPRELLAWNTLRAAGANGVEKGD